MPRFRHLDLVKYGGVKVICCASCGEPSPIPLLTAMDLRILAQSESLTEVVIFRFLMLCRVLQVRLQLRSEYGCRTFSSEIPLVLGAQDGLEERQSSDRKQALPGKVREPPRPVHVRCHPFSYSCLLSSISAARSSRSLSERRITHILSVCPDPIPGELPESGMTHLRIPVEDVDHADLLIYLPTAVRFIDQAMRSHGIVLVHCVQGLSRSATVVAAYCKSNWHISSISNLISHVLRC
jgi:hypothetical protein